MALQKHSKQLVVLMKPDSLINTTADVVIGSHQ